MQRMKMHPDLGGDHWQASLINEAFATLSDPTKRARYDQGLSTPAVDYREHAKNSRGADTHENAAPTAGCANSTGRFCPFCSTPHHYEGLPEHDCRICGSPLSMSSVEKDEYSWQRQVARIPKSFTARVYVDWPAKGENCRAIDVSPVGMCFASDTALTAGKIIKIDSAFCTAIAQVRRCTLADDTAGRYQTGVRFMTLRFNSSHGNFVSIVA